MSEELKETAENKNGAEAADTKSGSNGPVKMVKTTRTKACYKCGKPVAPEDHQCPHCKATGKTSKVNSAAYTRIALGFFLGLILWAIFYM